MSFLGMNKDKRCTFVVIKLGKGFMYTPIIGERDISSATPFSRGTLMTRTAIVKLGKKTSQERVGPEIRELLLIIREAQ